MAGKRLTKVLSTNDKGLIGITESGEEILLRAPISDFLIVEVDSKNRYNSRDWSEYLDQKEKGEREGLAKTLQNDEYIHFFNRKFLDHKGPDSLRFFIPYNVYTRRK